jgi:hypothetical protein
MLALVSRLIHQEPKGSDMLYALHEPAVDCISKEKARVGYEFGCKVSLATSLDRGFVVGMRSLPGNPYDGHTLDEALEQITITTETAPEIAVVDRGYRGHGVSRTRVLISGTRRGLTQMLARLLRRRSAIEPEIGHMKTDGTPRPLSPQGHHRRCDLRRPVRLRPQHPQDPRPPQDSLASNYHPDPGSSRTDIQSHGRSLCRLIGLFRLNSGRSPGYGASAKTYKIKCLAPDQP